MIDKLNIQNYTQKKFTLKSNLQNSEDSLTLASC